MIKSVLRAFALAAFCVVSLPAAAQNLVSGLSTDLIQITSSFAGTEIVMFGAVESASGFDLGGGRDIVVVIRGPATPVTVRRKERIAGIWVNTAGVTFSDLPGYYFLASTRPLADIAPARTLARFELGTANLPAAAPAHFSKDDIDAYRAAAVRIQKNRQLYKENAGGIDFLSQSLFRARIPIPAGVPPGQYLAEVYLFRGGTVISAQSTPLFIDKTGIERRLYNYAYNDSLLYGLAAALMAMALGWMAYLLFRRRA